MRRHEQQRHQIQAHQRRVFERNGRLHSEPACSRSRFGRMKRSINSTTTAATAITWKAIRQPSDSPIMRPIGMAATFASDVPVASSPSARLFSSGGASLTTSETGIDQKIT